MTNTSTPTSPGRLSATTAPVVGYSGTLIAACSAVFVSQAISALPASLNGLFQSSLNISGLQLTWITAAFMVSVVVFEFSFGVLGDMFGRKKLVIAGALLAIVGSIVSALAPSVEVLWLGAAINGLGAGAMFPGSLSLVAAITHSPEQRAKAVAMWAGSLSLAAAFGPMAGGIISSGGNWRLSYWFLAGLAAVALLLTGLLAVESSAPEGRKLDVPGQITFALGLLLVLYGVIQGAEEGWGSPRILGAFVIGAALLAAFLVIESKVESPILHLDLFRNRPFAVTALVSIIGMFTFLGVGYGMSMWLGPVQHQPPIMIALFFLVVQAPTFVLVPVLSRLLGVINPSWLLAAGWLLMGVGAFLLSRLDVTNTSFGPFVVPALFVGLGFALALNSMTAVALNNVPMHLVGMGSATINMIRDLGFALGPAIVGSVALSTAARTFGQNLSGAGLSPQDQGAAEAINGIAGPLAVNGLPQGAPGSGAAGVALQALGDGFSRGLLVAAAAALLAAILTVVLMAGAGGKDPEPEALFDPLHPDVDSEPVVELPIPVHPHQPGFEGGRPHDERS
ncbi:Major Facilitator Superfamily protein [Raineyella antarctica]|uniref:Major Facilitator Superfamily protein n=1 Tax=Raineyella antarctica TaxID=1577474 RepID=A0A1G6H122_9ACTN|nr:MFS transporter [Raineyella antarctica]SDB87959.1 Major Facilitator Superfamily protein [Raineyella antarctica]